LGDCIEVVSTVVRQLISQRGGASLGLLNQRIDLGKLITDRLFVNGHKTLHRIFEGIGYRMLLRSTGDTLI
jgi:hypothetical protein